jgi:hypothetical protein
MAEGSGLRVQASGGRSIASMRVGDARQAAVAQTNVAVRRPGRRQRLAVERINHFPAQPLLGILPSFRRGMSSAKLQGRKRMSSWKRRMSSQPSLQAPVEPGSAKI